MWSAIKENFSVKKYYVLISMIISVVAIFSSNIGAKLESQPPYIQGLAMLTFLVPTCLLLFFIGNDGKIKNGFRIVAKIGIVFLILCYIGGMLTEIG